MLPTQLKPMLAQPAEAAFDSELHWFEVKWDGIRCLAFMEGGRVRLQSRQLTDITVQFPELACLAHLPSGTVLDGELVVLREGKPFFPAIQQRVRLQSRVRIECGCLTTPVTYMVFDVPYLEGRPLVGAPFNERWRALQSLLRQNPAPGVVVLSEAVLGHGRRMFAEVARLGLEGIMGKRLDGPYLPGKRSRNWLKIKVARAFSTGARARQELPLP